MKFKIPTNAKITKINIGFMDRKLEMTGLKVYTDKGDVCLLIEYEQNCCEDWGTKFVDPGKPLDKNWRAWETKFLETP